MKADIHPDYREVVFHDVTSDFKFLTRSTLGSKETTKWEDGNEYPLIKVEISSASHPFYTGKHKVIDTSGRTSSAVPVRPRLVRGRSRLCAAHHGRCRNGGLRPRPHSLV